MRAVWLVALAVLAACSQQPQTGADSSLPHLQRHGTTTQLIVDGAPYLALGGELGNSTASSLEYLKPSWALFDQLHMNTVIAPASWELIEPQEGQFNFASVDGLIDAARMHNKRLVLLWFGAWKNSMSSYVPGWVKRDETRFPRAKDADGHSEEILTAFSDANRDADTNAFAHLMTHLRDYDSARHTVIMVQVENEIGMIPSARDHSDAANAAYTADVPPEAVQAIIQNRRYRTLPSGSWAEAFGASPETEEMFMAWSFARYTEYVAAAGKRVYPLPMYVNAALIRPGKKPGEYPSAGPLPQVFDLWRAGAPSIDILAPDIYFPNFVEWANAYKRPNNPLFIPETGRAPEATPANAFYAFGALDAIGFSPFSIESYKPDDRLASSYAILSELSPLILAHQGDGSMKGFRPPVNFDGDVDDAPQDVTFGDTTFHVVFQQAFRPPEEQDARKHGGLIIKLGADEYIIAGSGITVTFATPGAIVGIEIAWEGHYVSGEWH
ncbi:MAG: DUF5597 domain-containing protein, partial [Pseudomonadota bacterium]